MIDADDHGAVAHKTKVKGVCAVCRVDATPRHWTARSHYEKAAVWDRKYMRRLQTEQEPPQ